MKLRSGKVCNIMNPEFKSNELLEAVASLNELYKLGESKMATRNKVEIVNNVLHKVNLSYTTFSSLCSHLDANDMIPGTACTKIAFKTGHNEFKESVQQWLENRLRNDVPEGYCCTTAVNITTSPVDKLSMLDSAKPGYSSTLPQKVSTKPALFSVLLHRRKTSQRCLKG